MSVVHEKENYPKVDPIGQFVNISSRSSSRRSFDRSPSIVGIANKMIKKRKKEGKNSNWDETTMDCSLGLCAQQWQQIDAPFVNAQSQPLSMTKAISIECEKRNFKQAKSGRSTVTMFAFLLTIGSLDESDWLADGLVCFAFLVQTPEPLALCVCFVRLETWLCAQTNRKAVVDEGDSIKHNVITSTIEKKKALLENFSLGRDGFRSFSWWDFYELFFLYH